MRHPITQIFLPLSSLIPVIIGIYNYRFLSKAGKTIFYYAIFGGVMDFVSSEMAAHRIPNLMLLHFYTIAEFIILSIFFVQIFTKKGLVKTVQIISVLFTLLCLVNVVFFQKITQFNTYTRSLEALLIIIYCFMYFEQESRLRQAVQWQKRPNNWFVTSNLQYFACSFFLFLFSNVINIKVKKSTFSMLWDIHGFFVMGMYLLFAIGLWNERNSR